MLTAYDREYPFGWVGILSESPPPDDELIYAYHERGFALYTMRSPTLARLYLQCAPDEDIDELAGRAHLAGAACAHRRHATRWPRAPMLQKGITAMRSFVVEPMQYGRLFLAGDSAHIVPPTGAKGHESRARRRAGARARARRSSIAPGAAICSSAIRRPACGGSGRRSASPGG